MGKRQHGGLFEDKTEQGDRIWLVYLHPASPASVMCLASQGDRVGLSMWPHTSIEVFSGEQKVLFLRKSNLLSAPSLLFRMLAGSSYQL